MFETTNSPLLKKPFGGITANQLRLFALILMFMDHSYYTILPQFSWLTMVGRLAFPIFAFQIVEGFFHTSNRKRYRNRMLLFAVISEIPFDYMIYSTAFYPFHQNVMFTLAIGLWCMEGIEQGKNCSVRWRGILRIVARCILCDILAVFGMVDYRDLGLMTILVFYFFRDFPMAWLWQFVGMFILHQVTYEGMYYIIPFLGMELEIFKQALAIFALIPIWLYNGKKGRSSKPLQYAAYAFYPAHLLILGILKQVIW